MINKDEYLLTLKLIPEYPDVLVGYIGDDAQYEQILKQHLEDIDGVFKRVDKTNIHSIKMREFDIFILAFKGKVFLQESVISLYRGLENSGNIIILESNFDYDELYQVLDSANFTAINKIELESFSIISAKKMHGWGGDV